MKIKHNKRNYELDVAGAIANGYLVETYIPVTEIRAGDLFQVGNTGNTILIVSTSTDKDMHWLPGKKFSIIGREGCQTWSDTQNLTTEKQILEYINVNKMIFLGNVNLEIKQLLNTLGRKS